MKNTNPVAAKIAEHIKEINLANAEVNLAADYKKAKKIGIDIYSKIVDLKGIASKGEDKQMETLLREFDKALSKVQQYIDSKQ
jgi:hypothetical protein